MPQGPHQRKGPRQGDSRNHGLRDPLCEYMMYDVPYTMNNRLYTTLGSLYACVGISKNQAPEHRPYEKVGLFLQRHPQQGPPFISQKQPCGLWVPTYLRPFWAKGLLREVHGAPSALRILRAETLVAGGPPPPRIQMLYRVYGIEYMV